ncbi:putative methyltransferase [Trypanosoma rangeli]|uniref:Putative methyltransferase n=1 Tax=Trypanosoma rangeli TaxID=5698 RepID=A0A422N510_TRYRA|nr:putative methyltransferase [Trypanosoma rangeli]RNF00546.1 putative methyltransferase [Trypanosoma rangeli]|eukprot:RNF00546.1 putative methyltransferase [Trypanosoma rangeli]
MLFFAWFACNSSLAAFCVEELRAAAMTLGVEVSVLELLPWLCVETASRTFCVFEAASVAAAQQLAGRCVLLRAVHLLIAAAASLEDLLVCVGSSTSDGGDEGGRCLRGLLRSDETLRHMDCTVRVETIGRRYTVEEKSALAARVGAALQLPCEASVPRAAEQPPHRVAVVIEHALENAPAGAPASWQPCGRVQCVFCGVPVAESARQRLLATYDLRRRPYIGTTSMPPELAFVAVHMAKVRRGAYVLDPFCGTGSILVAAAHYGAVTLGADADGRVMRSGSLRYRASRQQQQQQDAVWRSHTQEALVRAGISAAEAAAPSMWTNFKLYGLTAPDRVRLNFATWRSALRPCNVDDGAQRSMTGHGAEDRGFLDAIVTDPPYGIREPRKKAERPPGALVAGADELATYPVSSITLDLLLFAAEALVLGGRLVFWYPTTAQYTDDELPTHPSLRLVCDMPQRISLKVVRRLVVLEKTQPLPFPSPSREACAATRQPQDLRALMDVTDLPDNADYMHYRSKLLRKRDATRRYFSTTPSPLCTPGDGHGSGGGGPDETKRRPQKLSRAERRELVVANRERNLQQQWRRQQERLTWREGDDKCDGDGEGMSPSK